MNCLFISNKSNRNFCITPTHSQTPIFCIISVQHKMQSKGQFPVLWSQGTHSIKQDKCTDMVASSRVT